jgi:hypothetical protein
VGKVEAALVADDQMQALRRQTYDELVERYVNSSGCFEVSGTSGTPYQVEVQAFWDAGKPGDLRVLVAVDDGAIQAFAPLTRDFIIGPDGSFVGE